METNRDKILIMNFLIEIISNLYSLTNETVRINLIKDIFVKLEESIG